MQLRAVRLRGHHLVEITLLAEQELGRAFFDGASRPNGSPSIHFREYRLGEVSGLQRRLRVSFV